MRRLVEIVNEGALEEIGEVTSGEIAAQAAGWIGPFRRSFPDFRMEIVHVIAEADAVAAHFKCSGTHAGEWRGLPATGRRFEAVDEIYLFAVRDGKLSSALAVVEDDLARMRQLGIDPSALGERPSASAHRLDVRVLEVTDAVGAASASRGVRRARADSHRSTRAPRRCPAPRGWHRPACSPHWAEGSISVCREDCWWRWPS